MCNILEVYSKELQIIGVIHHCVIKVHRKSLQGNNDDKGPSILKFKVLKAINNMRRKKATRNDNS